MPPVKFGAASRASYEVPSAVAVNNSLDLLVELVDDFDGRALWRAHSVPAAHLVACDNSPRAVAQRTLLEDRVCTLADVTRRLRTLEQIPVEFTHNRRA